MEGRVQFSQLREIRIEDLLGRESVQTAMFDHEVQQVYARKRILVTGAGGSIGSELVRQLLLFAPSCLAMLDKDENSIYELDRAIKLCDPCAPVERVVAETTCAERACKISDVAREQLPKRNEFHSRVGASLPGSRAELRVDSVREGLQVRVSLRQAHARSQAAEDQKHQPVHASR